MTDAEPKRVNLDELMRGCKKIILQHGKRPYCLTITRRGNLILTSADDDTDKQPSSEKPQP
ncbi:hemin uptake protein HemP [Thiothrix litoralis]|jgi:hemin uptake protein HemP|uniref:Hemin uptake protein HemP n=1 Tax=Thiothrix litoralis TaxID=2891210 RepID=A0ABX7WMW0_9GAMM|nr:MULTISPECIES: hemin uptake protein HemP [Thiothrix]QTR44587.1 hemin uptake protein HemP [Thiothrix litoralis]